MMKLFRSLLITATLLSSGAASSATLDFTALGTGFLGATTAVLPEASITGFGDDIYLGSRRVSNSICSIQGSNCEADLQIDFTSTVSNLTFRTGGYNFGDSVTASIYDAGNSLLSSVVITSDGLVDFSVFSGISRLFLDDNSSGAGFVYGEFNFDESSISPVPVPAAAWLFGSVALGLVGFARRRKLA